MVIVQTVKQGFYFTFLHLTDENTNSFKLFISGIQVAKFIVVLP